MKFKLTARGGSGTATTDEDPRKTAHVHAWFFRNGKPFNHCICPSAWLLSEYSVDRSGKAP